LFVLYFLTGMSPFVACLTCTPAIFPFFVSTEVVYFLTVQECLLSQIKYRLQWQGLGKFLPRGVLFTDSCRNQITLRIHDPVVGATAILQQWTGPRDCPAYNPSFDQAL
jgi:hypothetical protein